MYYDIGYANDPHNFFFVGLHLFTFFLLGLRSSQGNY